MVKVVKTRVEIEGRIHEETVVVEREEPPAWEADRRFSVVGRPVSRVDGPERVSGAARYTADVQLPGMLYAAVLRSPHAHARIKLVDTSAAEALPGVRAVLSGSNVPDVSWRGGTGKLFDDEVRFVGDEVAAVAADDPDTARDALRLIRVEYEPLPFIVDMAEAVRPGATQIHPKGNVLRDNEGREGELYTRGDVEKALASADVVVEATYRTPTALHNCLETHGAVAVWEGDELIVWESTQAIFGVRRQLARVFRMPENRVRVICEYMGGGFGSKLGLQKHTCIAALLARQTGRPVKLMLDRREENLVSGNRGQTVQHIRLGAKRDGTLVAIDLDVLYGIGIHGTWASAVAGPAQELYSCPNVRTMVRGVRTNLGTHQAFRAPGFVEGTFALECAVDELCAKLGMDPLEFRRKNHAHKDQVSGQEYSSKHLLECYAAAAGQLGLNPAGPLPPTGSANRRGAWRRGIGMASQIWSGGGGPPAHALVRLNSDGTVEVQCGVQDIGTGTRTALSQIAAEELGVPLESVRFRLGDTGAGPFAPASGGSATIASVGPAVRAAAEDARRQLLEVASFFMEVPADRLEVADGFVSVEGRPESRRSIKDVLAEIGEFMITGKGFRGPNPREVLRTWGAQFAEVEVNVDTGEVRVLRISAVHDLGRVINPMQLHSQLCGGILQGLGFALMEERVVDRRDGMVLNPNLQDYKVPTIADMPEMIVSALDRPDLLANHIGAKGSGEPPIIPTAAAIANAIYNATGVRVRELPITRRRLLEALAASPAQHA